MGLVPGIVAARGWHPKVGWWHLTPSPLNHYSPQKRGTGTPHEEGTSSSQHKPIISFSLCSFARTTGAIPHGWEQSQRLWSNPKACCSRGKLDMGWTSGRAWNAKLFFFFFPLYVTNAEEEEETARKYS